MMSSAGRGLDFPSLWQRSKLGERVGVRVRFTAPPRTPCSLERCGAARSLESIHPRQLPRDPAVGLRTGMFDMPRNGERARCVSGETERRLDLTWELFSDRV